jgi:hypothetical protein
MRLVFITNEQFYRRTVLKIGHQSSLLALPIGALKFTTNVCLVPTILHTKFEKKFDGRY